MDNKQYFSHDYYTRHKKKMSFLLMEEGPAGYGLFWIIAEMLHEESIKWLDLDQTTYAVIASQSKVSASEIETFIYKGINVFRIFIEKDGKFTTERVLANTRKRKEVIRAKKKAGEESARKRADRALQRSTELNTCSTPVQQDSTDVEQNPTKEKKEKEKKKKEKNTNTPDGVGDSDESPGEQNLDSIAKYNPGENHESKYIREYIETYKPKNHEPYVDLWNLFAEKYGLPAIKTFSFSRKRKLRTRLNQQEFDLAKILFKASASDFCLKSTWFTFDWVIENETNYLKVLEGNYDNKKFDTQHATTSNKSELSAAEQQGKEIMAAVLGKHDLRESAATGS